MQVNDGNPFKESRIVLLGFYFKYIKTSTVFIY